MDQQNQNKSPSGKKFRFGVGSVIDIVIILIIVAALVGIGFRIYATQHPTVSTEKGEYEVSFRVDSVSYMLPNYLRTGDEVYLSDSGRLLGVLQNSSEYEEGSALAVTPARVTVLDENGNYVSVSYPGEALVDAVGVVLASGYYDANGSFLLDGKIHITPGEVLHVRTELVDFSLTVTEIEKH